MWQGTLHFTKNKGSIKELLDAGVAILETKRVKHGDLFLGLKLKVRFTEETMAKLKKLDNIYIWTGQWIEIENRTVAE